MIWHGGRDYLLRHGPSRCNALGRFLGQGDSPLTALGRRLSGQDSRVWASPLERMRATLAQVFPGLAGRAWGFSGADGASQDRNRDGFDPGQTGCDSACGGNCAGERAMGRMGHLEAV